jgi:hypothetical protein
VSLKVVPKAACDPENFSESRPKEPMREKENRNRNLKRLSEQSLELLSVFKKASRNYMLIFLFTKAG